MDHNKNLYENLKKIAKEKPIYQPLLNFLEEDYLFYFQNVYYKNERTINLQKYGIDAILPLSEKDFISKMYIIKMKEQLIYKNMALMLYCLYPKR